MPLIIEDGTGKVDAQSYVSVDDFKAFANARGLPVPSSDAEIEHALIAAIDYLELQTCYKGKKTTSTQALEWPRKYVQISGEDFPDDEIPKNLKTAQIRLALESANGVDLMPTVSGTYQDYVIKEKVGPIETEFADPSKFSGSPSFTAVESLLASLIGEACKNAFSFTVYRG